MEVEKGGCGGGSSQALLCFRVWTGFKFLFKNDYLVTVNYFPPEELFQRGCCCGPLATSAQEVWGEGFRRCRRGGSASASVPRSQGCRCPGPATAEAPRGPAEPTGAMNPLRLRAPLPLLLRLLLGGCLLAAARRDPGAAGSAAESARGPVGGSSGRFVSPARHACSWQLLLSAPGPAAGSELWLRCEGPDGRRRRCAYRGEPERCAADAARRARYWRQVLRRLRRKRRPCQDPAPLAARLCAGGKGRGAELRLVPHAPQDPKPRTRSRDRPREPAIGPAATAPPPRSARPEGKPSGKKTEGGERKAASDAGEERALGPGPDPEGLGQNVQVAETYCAEKWHALCSLLVSVWNG